MYIKKAELKAIDEINCYVKNIGEPIGFNKYLNDKKIYISYKKEQQCQCGSCKKKFNTNEKLNEIVICPYCNKNLIIKSVKARQFDIKKYIILLQNYNEKYIARGYEIRSVFYNNQYSHIITEYSRQIINEEGRIEFGIISKDMHKTLSGYWYIDYNAKTNLWKPYKYLDLCYGMFYPDNIDEVLKTKYFKLSNVVKDHEINISDFIWGINTQNYTLEILIKAKLYNLAVNFEEFDGYKKRTFEEVFGIDRSYLKFMQDNDIDITELRILKELKIKDYDLIKYLKEFRNLEKLLKYCKPYDLYKYNLKYNYEQEYLDYIRFAKILDYDIKNKQVLYPKNLISKHNQLMEEVNSNKTKKFDKLIFKKYKKLKKNIYYDKKYIIFPVKNSSELIDESNQQSNCVKTYVERVAIDECDIYFMRYKDKSNESLVTVEVINNRISQQRTKFNKETTKEQQKFLKKFESKINQEEKSI